MGMKREALAKQFEAKAGEAAGVLAALSDADWKTVTEAERWTVGVTAHHLAGALEPVAGMITAIASGRSLGEFTGKMLDEMNAIHAREHADCTRSETRALLEKGAATAAAVIRGLSDAQLARAGTVFTDAPPMSAEALIIAGLIGHIDEHVESIRKTVGAPAAAGEIVITRVLDAPRALVFKAWTEPERVMRWWGPNGFTTPVCTIDLRPGGVVHTCMRSPEGRDYWSRGVYREIVEPERIVCTDSFADAAGNVVEPAHYGMSASWPREALITVTFAGQEGTTTLTLRHEVGSAPAPECALCRQGWSESLDRLAEYLVRP